MHLAKFSNQPNSERMNDGLTLNNIYLTLALKCVPPFDKPTSNELKECFKYLKEEFILLKNLRIIVTLGKIAFDSCLNLKESFVYN